MRRDSVKSPSTTACSACCFAFKIHLYAVCSRGAQHLGTAMVRALWHDVEPAVHPPSQTVTRRPSFSCWQLHHRGAVQAPRFVENERMEDRPARHLLYGGASGNRAQARAFPRQSTGRISARPAHAGSRSASDGLARPQETGASNRGRPTRHTLPRRSSARRARGRYGCASPSSTRRASGLRPVRPYA